MITGKLPFYCSKCHNRFIGMAAEWCATAFTAPVKCPSCGSRRTRPWSILPAKIADRPYKRIWEQMAKEGDD